VIATHLVPQQSGRVPSCELKLGLTDAASSTVLTEHFRSQAETCHQMAEITVNPFKQGWLELAAEWTNLAHEAEAKAQLERQSHDHTRQVVVRDFDRVDSRFTREVIFAIYIR
jgi:hypothetical protein